MASNTQTHIGLAMKPLSTWEIQLFKEKENMLKGKNVFMKTDNHDTIRKLVADAVVLEN